MASVSSASRSPSAPNVAAEASTRLASSVSFSAVASESMRRLETRRRTISRRSASALTTRSVCLKVGSVS